MGEILKKLDMFSSDPISETRMYGEKLKGMLPIQFMKFWNGFRPGDRVDVMFGEDHISLAGTNAEGHFAGVKKELNIENEKEMEEFKNMERDIWNLV